MDQKKNNKIVVIGSNSFSAGSFIHLAVKKKYKVYGISRSNINKKQFLKIKPDNKNYIFFKLDLNKNLKKMINLIKKVKPKYILNYASQSMVGQSWDNPQDWFKTNSLSTIKFYNSLSKIKFKFKLIHISTPEIYGNIISLTKESEIYNPNTPYAVSRVTADQFLSILNKRKMINYCSIRASNVYGEYQRLYRIIPKTIYCILKKKKLFLDGGGNSKRNFIHIDDVSEATYKILKKGKIGNIYHISSNEVISIKNLVKFICKKMNYNFSKLVKLSPERKGKDKYYILSNKKIKGLGWKPKISIDRGIQNCIEWIKKDIKSFSNTDETYTHKK